MLNAPDALDRLLNLPLLAYEDAAVPHADTPH